MSSKTMMKLKVLKSFMFCSEPTKVGDVVHVPIADARYIIWRGMAEEVKEYPVVKESPVVKEQPVQQTDRRSR